MKTWFLATSLTTWTWLLVAVHSQSIQNSTVCTVSGGLDLVFVLDVSGSIGATNFQMIREFAEQISMSLEIGPQRSLVGVILFGSSASIHFPVTQHTNAATLLPALNPGLPYDASGTNTAAALELLRTDGQPGGALGLRSGYLHAAIVVTDGQSNNQTATINAAMALHTAGIYNQTYAVGISGADIDELNAIASDNSLVFFTSNFSDNSITTLEQNFLLTFCNSTNIIGDPHFMVPLLSHHVLCYSIQGYPGLSFNLIYNEDYVINALFVDSVGDKNEATWIGKLAVIPRLTNKSEAVIFDSVKQEVVLVGQGNFRASVVEKVSFDENGEMSVRFTPGITKQTGNPKVHVKYGKPFASFHVSFYSNHLDVNWDFQYDSIPKMHGLIGQFMVKGMAIDPIKKILTYPDDRDPVAVEIDTVMTGKECWKAMNPGHQGEGLIEGSILDYIVSNLLEDDFKLKDF